ncbi:MAG: CPBP family intramembrane metalloprotease [Capsulimonadaceae bacterium]|nr:CPBP family intramembrane metalloprotease [Capsulimonadaceae bacterium]
MGDRSLDRAAIAWTVALALMPWPLVYLGAYFLHSAVAAFGFYHGLCVTVWVFRRRACRCYPNRPVYARVWTGLLIAGLAVSIATAILLTVIGVPSWLVDPVLIRHAMAALHAVFRFPACIGLYLYFAVVNPVAEEIFWRGVVYVRLRNAGCSVQSASIVSAVLFGSWHCLTVLLFFPPAMVVPVVMGIMAVGYVFAALYERYRSLPALILIHALTGDIPALIALAWAVHASS